MWILWMGLSLSNLFENSAPRGEKSEKSWSRKTIAPRGTSEGIPEGISIGMPGRFTERIYGGNSWNPLVRFSIEIFGVSGY